MAVLFIKKQVFFINAKVFLIFNLKSSVNIKISIEIV